MVTKKAGTILLNLENKKVALVYDRRNDSYAFPKGHLEEGESLPECAIRETEEETLRSNHLLNDEPIHILKYTTPSGEDVNCYMYVSIDDGPTEKEIAENDKEIYKWFDYIEVENNLKYDDLKEFWENIKNKINNIFENN